jgi:DNA mismatch repair protein MutL
MSAKIRVLDENTINKIAAGEVIENPSSVVKELVENSIDAGATEISIEIKTGGRQLIRISDNGCGMNQDDAVLSLERHATSKLRNIDDIFAIETMGFRGEAVPSIASISKFTLITNDKTDTPGTMVIVDGGKIYQVAPAARSRGTTMEVKNLFFNVPVRRKFQRSPTYDANEILKIVSIQAMGYPEIKFELISDGKTLLSAMRAPDLQTRVKDVLGGEFGRSTLAVHAEHDAYKVDGIIGYPTYTRQNRTGQYLFINKRAITSPIVAYAVRDAYGTALSTTRHPVWVLHLTIPTDLIDVNVHPQKREVRLRQQDEMRQFIIDAVNNALGGKSEQVETQTIPTPEISLPTPPMQSYERIQVRPAFTFEIAENPQDYTPQKPIPKPQPKEPEPTFLRQAPAPTIRVLASIPSYLIIDSDTLPQRGDGLCLMDQRAAHRRIIYESLSRDHVESQQLLIPITWHLSTQEMGIVQEHLETFREIGIQLHESGPDSFMIDAIPSVLKSENIETVLQDVLHKLDAFQDKSVFKKELEKQIAEAAGRAAISTKAKLNIYEAQKLVDQLMKCKNSMQCPLGKPILKQISPEDLALQFRSH